MNKGYRRGWFSHSYEHYLAAKGIKTARKHTGIALRVRNVPVSIRSLPRGMAYPVTPEDVKEVVGGLPEKDVKGLKGVEFVSPKDKLQEESWAQYIRSQRVVKIFGQKVGEHGKLGGDDAKLVREHVKSYVIPHEVGHHVALRRLGTDKRLSLAEARADGYAYGMSPSDRDVKRFEKDHKL